MNPNVLEEIIKEISYYLKSIRYNDLFVNILISNNYNSW